MASAAGAALVAPVGEPASVEPAVVVGDLSASRRDLISHSPGNGPSPEDIQRRAYQLYLEHGCRDGRDLEDWLEAERELIGR